MINQKHYSDLGSDTSSVWKFCSRTSDLISQGRSNGGVAKCGLFSQDNTRQKQPAALQLFPFLLSQAGETRRLRKEAKKIKKLLSLLFFSRCPRSSFRFFACPLASFKGDGNDCCTCSVYSTNSVAVILCRLNRLPLLEFLS